MDPAGRAGPWPSLSRRRLAAGAAVGLLVGLAAALITRELVLSDAPERPPRAPAPLRFSERGISLTLPAGWRRLEAADPEVVLLAEGQGASMLVRTAQLGLEAPRNLKDAKRISDRVVRSSPQRQALRAPQQITLGGLGGYLYLYTFAADPSGRRGAHAHYFLFRAQTLITIVFQTVPAERLEALAPVFDRIGETLQVTG